MAALGALRPGTPASSLPLPRLPKESCSLHRGLRGGTGDELPGKVECVLPTGVTKMSTGTRGANSYQLSRMLSQNLWLILRKRARHKDKSKCTSANDVAFAV